MIRPKPRGRLQPDRRIIGAAGGTWCPTAAPRFKFDWWRLTRTEAAAIPARCFQGAEPETHDDRVDGDPAGTLCATSSPDRAPVGVDRRSDRGVVPQPGPAGIGGPGLDLFRSSAPGESSGLSF